MTGELTWLYWLIGGVVALGGLVLLAWALLWDRARGRRRCPRCWYDMAGVPGLLCPECGREARAEKRLKRTRRRWRWAVGAVLAVALGLGTAAWPQYNSAMWVRGVPSIVLALWYELWVVNAGVASTGIDRS